MGYTGPCDPGWYCIFFFEGKWWGEVMSQWVNIGYPSFRQTHKGTSYLMFIVMYRLYHMTCVYTKYWRVMEKWMMMDIITAQTCLTTKSISKYVRILVCLTSDTCNPYHLVVNNHTIPCSYLWWNATSNVFDRRSPIGFLFLRLPPPPCAVQYYWSGTNIKLHLAFVPWYFVF